MRTFFENLYTAAWLASKTFRTVWVYVRNSGPDSPPLHIELNVTPTEEA